MDHDDVLEQLELAAVEPGGLERLMAGDTAMAAAVVGHLAGCDECAEELAGCAVPRRCCVTSSGRRRRPTCASDAGLRRASTGAPRGPATARDGVGRVGATPPGAGRRRRAAARRRAAVAAAWVAQRPRRSRRSLLVGRDRGRASPVAPTWTRYARTRRSTASRPSTRATLDITAEPDAARVALASTDGGADRGTLLFSPSTTELVVVATA